MATLLLELFSEEIPSRMQRNAAEQLQRLITAGFEKNMLAIGDVKTFVSPRHLAIQIFGLPAVQPDVKEEKRGPKIGAPEQALKGFLQSTGLRLDQCEQRDGYYYANIERKGRPVADVVKEICEAALSAFSWPKSMRWGNRPLTWVRPLHRIACLLDDKIVPVTFAHLTASNLTEGHRFMGKGEIKISHAEKYEAQMKDACVIVDFAARREQIKTEITKLAASAKLTVVDDEALLDEVTGLVEWPVPLLCQFDKKFLDLPPEVLISEMKNHQRYFALHDASGKLTDQFITVANMVTKDGGAKVKEGNGRVVRARLADGEFYWEQDRKVNLEHWAKKLSDVVFHAKVGMMDKKVDRIEKLALAIAKAVNFADEKSVRRAAQLCKADLTSGMVGEFPELQGIMGRYYATAQGESQEIADAIRDHYKPLGANDSLPDSALAAIIALADKLDSIISLFAAGEKPTGSKDPLALRRAALGVLRILDHYKWDLDIDSLIEDKKIAGEIILFFFDRLNNLLREKNVNYDIIDALFADSRANSIADSAIGTTHSSFVPVRIAQQAQLLQDWLKTDAGTKTLAAIKRTINMLAAEEKKAKTSFDAGYFNTKNAEAAELALYETTVKVTAAVTADPLNALSKFVTLAGPINTFFDETLINDPTHRTSRLSLLADVRKVTNQFADFSKLEG